MVPSAVVELNRAVAIAMADGPDAGLALVDELEANGTLDGYHLLPATRADLLRRLDRNDEAAVAYRAALTSRRPKPNAATSRGGSPRSKADLLGTLNRTIAIERAENGMVRGLRGGRTSRSC